MSNSMTMRRINKELETWNQNDLKVAVPIFDESSNTPLVKLPYCTLRCASYPFQAPKHDISFGSLHKNGAGLDPVLWCLAVLINPTASKWVTSWTVECVCCESVTCKWHVGRRLSEVASEVYFVQLYKALQRARCRPGALGRLPVEILEHMCSLC